MAYTPQYIVAGEGFDIYPAGNIGAGHPWYIINAAYQGSINSGAGAFGGSALTFPMSGAPSALTSGFEYQFPSTLGFVRGNTAAGGAGAFAFNFWLNVTTMSAGSGTLLGLGTSSNSAQVYSLLNIINTTTGGTNLLFPTNINSPTSNPYQFAIQFNTQYWVSLQFSYYSPTTTTFNLFATYSINGTPILKDVPVTWSGDNFSSGAIANRFKFYCSNFLTYFMDDLVIQASSSQDSNWAGGTTPTPETIPLLSPRRIYAASASGPGSNAQMTPSGSEPNWQSATDPTGANYVTATAAGQTDSYKWSIPAMSDVKAAVTRGKSNRYGNLNGAFLTVAAGAVNTMNTSNGPSAYIGISETPDGTNPWTTATAQAGEFGMQSH